MKAEAVTNLGRKSVRLGNGQVSTLIDAIGGMVPEFVFDDGKGGVNAHWLPPFRDQSGKPFSAAEHGEYWKARLLYLIAGDFPCSPNFGGGCTVDGVELPPHGWTANDEWTIDSFGVAADSALAFARFSLRSPVPAMPLTWDKCNLVLGGQNALYSLTRIANSGSSPIAINLAHHNTIGAPFLAPGCRITLAADRFRTPPLGGEFDTTGRLAIDAEFADLRQAPLRGGGTADVGLVPGMIGFSDLVTGAIPAHLDLGWSCVVNPQLGLAYICFFPGEAGLPAGEVALTFNDLWLQYGGRPFTPWAERDGEADRTYCLGTENSVGAYANGLEYARNNPELLGRPTLVTIPAGGERLLCYGTALVPVSSDLIGEGVRSIEAEEGHLVLKGARHVQKVPMDARFARARAFEVGRQG